MESSRFHCNMVCRSKSHDRKERVRNIRMSSLVELEETVDIAKKLLDFVDVKDDNINAQCTTALKGENYRDFINVLMTSGALFDKADSTDVENIFNIISHMLRTNVDEKDQLGLISLLCDTVASSKQRTKLRLRILCSLYNLMEGHVGGRTQIAMRILKYAQASGQMSLISQSVNTIVSQIESSTASKDDVREIYYLAYLAMESHSALEEAQQLLIKYLATYEGESASVMGSIKDRAAAGVVGAIKAPFLSFTGSKRSRIRSLSAVQQLKTDPLYAPLYNLLGIFMHGDMAEFSEFISSNGTALKEFGFDEAACSEKMRLLTLCSIAAGAHELKYEVVAKELQVSLDDVEDWIIQAIMEKLIEAKLDQVRQTIIINRAMPRTFGDQQWESLGKKLNDWKANVKQLLTTVQTSPAMQQA